MFDEKKTVAAIIEANRRYRKTCKKRFWEIYWCFGLFSVAFITTVGAIW